MDKELEYSYYSIHIFTIFMIYGMWCFSGCTHKMAASLEFTFSYKGKEYLFVEETKKTLEALQCPVCFEIVMEPVQTSCGHLFCKKCIEGVATCPVCREQFTSIPDHFNNRRVRSLRVKCPFTANGCKWVGDLGDVNDHEAVQCEFQPKPCPYCDIITIQKEKLKKHLTTCGQHTFPCPNGCGAAPSRKNLDTHLDECPEQLIRCKFSILGCDVELPRKKMDHHIATSEEHSTDFLLQHVMKLTVLVSQLCAKSGVPMPLEQKSWLQNKVLRKEPLPPWVFRMEGFLEIKENDFCWYSDPVYSHFGGYKMCLRVDANGETVATGTHVSVFIYLMRGNNDDNLKWPFKGTIEVSLLNQLQDGQHHTMNIWSHDERIPETACGRITQGEKAACGYGQYKFISHKDLKYQGYRSCQYLKDNTLFFRVNCFEPKLG